MHNAHSYSEILQDIHIVIKKKYSVPCGTHCLGLAALHVLELCDFHMFSPPKKKH